MEKNQFQEKEKVKLIKLYKSTTGLVHLVQGGYISCNHSIGSVTERYSEGIFEGTRNNITCKNCRFKLN